MDVRDKAVVITGGAGAIGSAMARRFSDAGAAAVVVADLDPDAATTVAAGLGAPTSLGLPVDVTDERSTRELITRVQNEVGEIDVYCSHAGDASGRHLDASDDDWNAVWRINVMAHVYAARMLVPRMAARESGGYLLLTSSAAGVLTYPDPAYAVTKSATVALGEWLSIWYGGVGVRASVLCPRAVRTPKMIEKRKLRDDHAGYSELIDPDVVAEAVLRGLAAEQFLIFDRPGTYESLVAKTTNHEQWIVRMRAEWDVARHRP